MNASFLSAHITKRHPTSVVSESIGKITEKFNDAGSHAQQCGKDCQLLREKLRIAEMRLSEEMNIQNIPEDSNKVGVEL